MKTVQLFRDMFMQEDEYWITVTCTEDVRYALTNLVSSGTIQTKHDFELLQRIVSSLTRTYPECMDEFIQLFCATLECISDKTNYLISIISMINNGCGYPSRVDRLFKVTFSHLGLFI